MGRPPIGERALTPAEKQRRYRERKKAAAKSPEGKLAQANKLIAALEAELARTARRRLGKKRVPVDIGEQINGWIRELEPLIDFNSRLTTWHTAYPDMPEDGREALTKALFQYGDMLMRLAQKIDGR